MTIRPPRLVVSLGLLGLLSIPAEARQNPPAPAPAVKAEAGAGFSPLGDPTKFTRMGGWGGFGGAIGQFGLGKAMLVTTPAVQKELKLSDKQKGELRDWSDALRKRGETMFRGMGQGQNQGQPPAQPVEGGQNPEPGGPPPGFNPLGMIDMVTNLVAEGEASLARILDKKQLLRLNQIVLQMEGVSALGRQDVAEAMYLSDDQIEAIREILKETRDNRIGTMMRQMVTMRGQRPRPEATPPAAAKSKAEEDPEAVAKRRAADRSRREAEMTRFREGFDRIQDTSNAKILRLLSRRQRERFDKLLGEPFDVAKLNGAGGFGGMGRPGGPRPPEGEVATETDPKPAAKAAPTPPPPARSRLREARGIAPKAAPEP